MRKILILSVVLFSFRCGNEAARNSGLPGPAYYSGGATTVFDETSQAYSLPATNLTEAELKRHDAGDTGFEEKFVTAGSDTPGLGPVFNNTSCEGCHIRDGRGQTPKASVSGGAFTTMFFRVSIGNNEVTGPVAVPGMGIQLQDKAIFDETPEGKPAVTYTEIPGQYADGTTFSLRKPAYSIKDIRPDILYAMALSGVSENDIKISPRVTPPVFGRGLLEAVSEETLESLADPYDADRDGISGRVNRVYSISKNNYFRPGRFGLKAGTTDVLDQSAGAYHGDIGISTIYADGDKAVIHPDIGSPSFSYSDVNTYYCHLKGGSNCSSSPSINITDDFADLTAGKFPLSDPYTTEPEVSEEVLNDVVFYTQTLAVPARRNVDDPEVQRGEKLFDSYGCADCHIPRLQTGHLKGVPAVSNQTIFAYTDLLLHDMGGGLADGFAEFKATGTEFKTPPLWGVGLVETVHGHSELLHDGRARNLAEAILWHGGEAESAREKFRRSSATEREALIAFLRSL